MAHEKNKTFRVVTLGCRTNQYESQAYRDQLLQMGYRPAQEGEEAGLCIINTCTVTKSADSSSRHEIRLLIRENPKSKVIVTGCSAEREPDVYAAIEGVTHIVPNKDKENLLPITLEEETEFPEFSIFHFSAHTRAFVKVQDGCNSFCTYCIIPYVRGRSRSRTIPSIVREVEQLIAQGYKDIVLTGINIGDFDGNPGKGECPRRLAELIRAVDNIPGIERLRLSSIDPDEVDDELACAILEGKHTCHSMHIVLQSGSNVILKRMNRKYTRQMFYETIDRLRSASSDFTFTTDVIVGFPGETDIDFEETLEAMRYTRFAKVHMFPYSDRPRTRSNLYPDKVSPAMMRERKQRALRLAEEMAFALREGYVGRVVRVLTENKEADRPNEIFGHTENFLGVWMPDEGLLPNQLVDVELVANTPQGFVGRVIETNIPLSLEVVG